MKYVDVAVIGAGVLGCFAARHLQRWQLDTVLIEAADDVCMGISRANSAVVYAGYDNQPDSLKAKLTVASNVQFAKLCDDLGISFKRCGGLMVSHGPNGQAVFRKKFQQGQALGVPGLALLSGTQARELEPMLAESVTAALYAPSVGTVNPWHLTIAAYDNARENGCQVLLKTRVEAIHRDKERYLLETSGERIACRAVVNCAGLFADKVQEMAFAPSLRLRLDGADYLVLDKRLAAPQHVLFQERESGGKGITVVPTLEGNLLLESSARRLQGALWAASFSGLQTLQQEAAALLPDLNVQRVIRSFAAVRPNPFYVGDAQKSAHDFVIAHPAPGFVSLIGVKTPGLTCANSLGETVAAEIAAYLQASPNPRFNPKRKMTPVKDEEILCLCGQLSKGAVLEAIRQGATTVDGVKHRVGTGMGPCQGGRCRLQIEKLLEAHAHGKL